MFAGSIMKGVAIMIAPLSAGLGSAVGENSATWIFNRMPASTGGAGPSDVEDFDDICRAQLAHAALLAQGVVNIVESLVFAEGTRSAWGIGVAVASWSGEDWSLDWSEEDLDWRGCSWRVEDFCSVQRSRSCS